METHLLTPASLKALAHPIRVRLLGQLRADGPSTATALGEKLSESSGTTSYHLRQLEKAGFVVEDEGRGNGRERWWRAAQQMTRLDPKHLDDDPATQAAADAFLNEVARVHVARLDTWMQESRTWPRSWQDASNLSDYRMSLTAAELLRLNDELDAVIERYRREPKRGDRSVAVHVQTFPMRSS